MKSPQQKNLERKSRIIAPKSFPEIQTILQGGANHFRAHILFVLLEQPGMNLDQINQLVGGDFKNISFHVKKLHTLGLVYKKYEGNSVHHRLSNEGRLLAQFIKKLTDQNILPG
ncbi:helix-turn-helix transcriptional regulator [Patescibacteria group bacterium]|nr:helix-turn-helix transcriptional regulator [Patescibacteria group bacterium]